MTKPWIENWDDERAIGNSLIVTLAYGYSFDPRSHEGVRGFDTVAEAKKATRLLSIYKCRCGECKAQEA